MNTNFVRHLKLISSRSSFWTTIREGERKREREGETVVSSRNNLLLSEPLNFLSNCRFYFQATGNAFTSRQFSFEAPRRFVVGCTCCNVATARVARELSSGNVVIMRHSAGTSQIATTRVFSAPDPTARLGFPESCEVVRCRDRNFFYFFFNFLRTRTVRARCQIDRRKVFLSPCCKECSM